MTAETIAKASGGRKVSVNWMARCPTHDDCNLSLSIRDAVDGRALVTRGSDATPIIAQGLRCFPCHADKTPATPRGYKDASSEAKTVEELWRRYPGPLVGVPTGEMSGFDVLDIDPRHGGDRWLIEHKSLLPTTRVHETRSAGFHIFFRHAFDLRCSAGKIAAGIDVRASGGYIIWWPSVGFSVISEMPIAPWPNWLRHELSHSRRQTTPRITVPDDYALSHLVRLIAAAREGERNNLTYWAACRAGEMAASGLLKADVAAAVIAEAAMRSGLPRPEAERTAWSGIRRTGGIARA